MTLQLRPVTPEEMRRALAAIEAVIPVANRLVPHPQRFDASDHGDELLIWVYDRDPATVAAGEVYGTVFLRFTPDREPQVGQFRSRRRVDGDDDTIP